MNTRRAMLLALGALALPRTASAQQRAPQPWRIGFLGSASGAGFAHRVDVLRGALYDLGYVEGRNIIIEFRWADANYDRLPQLAAELVRLPVDVIVTYGTPGTLAAKRATTTIPIVMATSGDAVASGLVASLAQPGGNITGSTFFAPQLMAKGLELIKDTLPRTEDIAVLLNRDNPTNGRTLEVLGSTSRSIRVRLRPVDVSGPDEFESAFAAMNASHVDAIVVHEETMLNVNFKAIAALAAKHQLASVGSPEYVIAGGLIGYGVDFPELWRRAARFVDKILKGAKPADIPIEQPSRFKLVVNLKTAKALGVTIPQSVLFRADEVIE